MCRNTIMALRCRAASPLEWEVSFLLIQAEAASRLGLIQALAPLALLSALRSFLCNQPGGWWVNVEVSFLEASFLLEERSSRTTPHSVRVQWDSVAAVCFVDGGLGSDCFYIYAADGTQLAAVPVESTGGSEFWSALKERGLFPAEISGHAVQSNVQGSQLWWPPQPGR
jgi:hypothetical protein